MTAIDKARDPYKTPPPHPKKPSFWSRLATAVGTALGEAFVNR